MYLDDINNTTMDGNTTLDGNNTDSGNGTFPAFPNIPINYFGYNPNKEMELAVLILFCICTIGILIQNIWKKTGFMTALVVGGIMEMISFAAMIYVTHNMSSMDGYIIYLVCILVAPTVLAAGDYALAGHLMTRGRARVACFTPRVTKYLFLLCDIVAFFTQAVGAVIVGSAKTLDQIKSGANIVLGGLAISLTVFVVFGIFSFVLRKRILRNLEKDGEDTRWTRIFYVVFLNMLLLAIRGLYRVAEFQQKLATPPSNSLSSESFFYGFDAMLMVVLMLSWFIFHPFHFGMHNWEQRDSIPMTETPGKKFEVQSKN